MPPYPIRPSRACRSGLLVLVFCLLATACQHPPTDDAARAQRINELFAGYRQDFPDVPEMAPAAALSLWREGKAVFIDARSDAERAVSTLPGAVTVEQFTADPGRYAGKTAVAYCTIGYRSGLLTRKLNRQGLAVANLEAGLLGWLHAGGTLVDAAGAPTRRVHVYGRTWDLAPLAYTAVW
ncbi:rhodanese-like domain-containing protein [Desulfovibrio sp. TomC]|uniref:rhodanese-like domain-containing protein n=1 Tax=Desulfovibrio sp. TomC TaxID=1562888 RepID=UPI0005735EDD|nr:rhodanese-like domain-containing protein [Desulfovibrio sp. TomC]KHK04111.1 putative MPT-synthase sulfurylase [Desulfovibrio sp. TomC]